MPSIVEVVEVVTRVGTGPRGPGRIRQTPSRALCQVLTLAFLACATAGPAGCYLAVDSGSKGSCADDPSCWNGAGGSGPSLTGVPNDPGCGGAGTRPSTDTGGVYGGAGAPGPAGAGGRGAAGSGGGQTSGPYTPVPRTTPPATCPTVTVSRFNELMIIDPGVTNDSRANNQSTSHPWSFRQRLEDLAGGATEAAGSMADAWLAGWSTATDVPVSTAPGAARVPIEPRPAAQEVLRCPWLRQSSENACDATCDSCRSRHLDLSRAPFRLLAIVNRSDLAGSGTATGAGGSAGAALACGANGGEVRFVYGAADPSSLRALPFTVIFEYGIALLPGETLRDWAAAWHELGVSTVGSSAYNARLDSLLSRTLARATLRRVLTNEVAFGVDDGLPWEMRQFVPMLTDSGTVRLVEVAMSGTPRLTLAQSAELGQWIDDNASAVLANDNPLPASMLAASAPIPSPGFAWTTTARNTDAGAAFNRNTCNGCHGGRSDPMDVPFQHVAPPTDSYYGSGGGTPTPRLSRYLHNPGHDDELGRRERKLAGLLCTACATPTY